MTYYNILEISETASMEVIHMAYKALARKYHPDVFGSDSRDAEEKMKQINIAYATLSDPQKRKNYDGYLRSKRQNTEQASVDTTANIKNEAQHAPPPYTYPTKKRSFGVIGLNFFLLFSAILVQYVEQMYDSAYLYAILDLCIISLIMMFIPLLVCAFKKDLRPNNISKINAINSIVTFVFFIVLYLSDLSSEVIIGGLGILCYCLINKHVLLQICAHTQSVAKRRLAAAIIFGSLLLVGIIDIFAFNGMFNTDRTTATFKSNELTAEEIYEKVSPSTVEIATVKRDGSYGTGSGFFIDNNGTIITNYHVIEECTEAVIFDYTDEMYAVTNLIGYDTEVDIAILSTTCKDSLPADIAQEQVKTGETVYTLGSSESLTGTFSEGIIASVGRKINGFSYLQTSAPVSHGNSGSPLINKKGEVVGVICMSLTEGQNINFAIPVETALSINTNASIPMEDLFTPEVEYLSDWNVWFDSELEQYILVFSLKDGDEAPLVAEGKVRVEIINDASERVYLNTVAFGVNDFDYWHYDYDSSEKLQAAVTVKIAEIHPGVCATGEFIFTVEGEDYSFEEEALPIDSLPLSSASESMLAPAQVLIRTITLLDRGSAEFIKEEIELSGCEDQKVREIMDVYGPEQGGGEAHLIGPGEYVDQVDDWCFSPARKPGDIAIIENIYGYTICYISEIYTHG